MTKILAQPMVEFWHVKFLASCVEMMAVNAYLVDIGELDANDFTAFERPTEDDLEKAAKVCDAILNLQHEQKGTGKVLEGWKEQTERYESGRKREGMRMIRPQGIAVSDSKGDAYKLLLEYASACGYEEDAVVDFVGKKRNWAEIVNEAGKAKGNGIQNIADVWTDMLKELLESFGKNLSDELEEDGAILGYVSGEERFEIESGRYQIKQEKDQTFTITDRETGEIHTFSEKQARIEKDKESGKTYLINRDDDGKTTDVMEVSEELLGYLNAYFMTNHIKPGERKNETDLTSQ